MELIDKIKENKANIVVVGLGYVGLPLAVSFAEKGFNVIGYDISEKKVNLINRGKSDIIDVCSNRINKLILNGNFYATKEKDCLGNADVIIICVPTPLTKTFEPDISYIKEAMKDILKYFSGNTLIVLESTTYPGTSREIIHQPLIELGFMLNQDYYICYSPERVDPGNPAYKTENTPKVVGGISKKSTNIGKELYGQVVQHVIPVATTEVAEMSKLLENTFRSINIAFINEMALLCEKMNINIWETIDAASTKPFGFMRFNPGPGIGGHCIPLDPVYLSWKAKESQFFSKFIELAQETNQMMPEYMVSKAMMALNQVKKPINSSKVLLIGMAYKENIDDLRESPGIEIFEKLENLGADVSFCDPLAKNFIDNKGVIHKSIELNYQKIKDFDLVILFTCHDLFNISEIAKHSKLILDTKNYLGGDFAHKTICFGNNIV
ncbi:nucleotide sugar dehydrogenase [Bacillus thuringiensis]|nr:nucleotide sugar dehydrogenase [Bacillus thuringiensis]